MIIIKNSNKKVKNSKKKVISLILIIFLILLIVMFIFFKGLCLCTLLYSLKKVFNPLRIVFALVVSIVFFMMNSSKLFVKVIKSLLLFLIIFIVLGIVWICFLNIFDNNCVDEVLHWDKPILYLYPDKDMNVLVRLEKDNLLMTTYPKYNNGWDVYVLNDGSIYDEDGKYYYALYWDEENINKIDFSTGFYVEKDNAMKFLEDKLSYIGLNDRERNEFIMYWLPKLEDNGKSLVYFELTEERELNNKLIINPKPDSMLRISMHIKKVNKKISIKEQKLDTFVRRGFTVVEWGGTIHK